MPFPMRTEPVPHFIRLTGKGKGQVHSITGHEGPEEEQRYSSTLSLTSALDGVGPGVALWLRRCATGAWGSVVVKALRYWALG
jgi:hypothetical protein